MNPEQILERFSSHLKNIVAKAMALATSLEQTQVNPLMLLIVLYEEKGSVAAEILNKFKWNNDILYKLLETTPLLGTEKTATAILPQLNTNARKAMEKAMLLAYERGHAHVGSEHLLHGLINCDDQEIKKTLAYFKISNAQITEQIESIVQSISNFPDIEEVGSIMSQLEETFGNDEREPLMPPRSSTLPKNKRGNSSALDLYTTNLTDEKIQKNIDPVIGRESEIERLVNILARRTKNNPVLIGEPGVGKTAIVEGLAKRISENKVPAVLRGKKLLSLDMTLLISGTIYRGEFEARLKQVIDEVSKSPNIILFIDELHNIIGAGSSQGAMDAANILKPALARGLLRCIGATTLDEYKKHLANDPALERRFQTILVDEPNEAETAEILLGIKKYYENFHHLKITAEALITSQKLSDRYIHDNFQPDKTIDLLDEACAYVRSGVKLNLQEEKIIKLRKNLEEIISKKDLAVSSGNFNEALELKKQLEDTIVSINNVEKSLQKNKKIITKKVGAEHIIHVLATRLNIDEKILTNNEWQELSTLAERLNQNLFGQENTIKTLVKNLRQASLGLKNKKCPFASFLFAGPSGVGKTYLAKILAKELFHDEKALVKLDMSEFSESHSTSKLLGSPAGYVGYKERNRFLEDIRRRPYCVLLLDEIDKAHPDVIKLLLQILDEGQLTDSGGKKTHFNHAVIILTTNLGAEYFKNQGFGFGASTSEFNPELEKNIKNKLKEELTSTIIGRLDNILIFSPLNKNTIKEIIKNQVDLLNNKLKETQNLIINLSKDALEKMAEESWNENEGARQVEKILQDTFQDLVIDILQKNNRKKTYQMMVTENNYQLK
ncbi:MAG: ATPase [Candidatus Magasanikbacteria bacterium GW2011_GWC2_37_14]|uniref:ATPase n=1 Tax=Candidatus Magasanikbacteria bacterium GW2011_GWC2_37_14 TaxID=1619046 RepID=A0A0G0IUN4_9BACT|nr:MAG: ATPase [Candidatus Magasanikbacteria bacterium GW2011_GWC2_37_14]